MLKRLLLSFLLCHVSFLISAQWSFTDSVSVNIPTTSGLRPGIISLLKPTLAGTNKIQGLAILAVPQSMLAKVRAELRSNDVFQAANSGRFAIGLLRFTGGPDTLFSNVANLPLYNDSLKASINRLASRASRPELQNVPLLPIGVSACSRFAMVTASAMPLRTAALVGLRAYRLDAVGGVSLATIPHLVQTGEVSGPDWRNNAAIYYSLTMRNQVLARRSSGELIHQVVEMNASQSTFKKRTMEYLLDFITRSISKRVPANSDGSLGPVNLISLSPNSGFLGNSAVYNNFLASNFSVGPFSGGPNPSQSGWFYDSDHANFWKQYQTSLIASVVFDPPPSVIAPYCTGERPSAVSAAYQYNSAVQFQPDNVFRIEVSDVTGNFDHPVYVARYSGSTRGNALIDTITNAILPDNFQYMTNVPTNSPRRYRIRLVSTNPYIESYNSGEISTYTFCPNRATRIWFSTARPFKPFYFRGDSITLTCYKLSTTTATNSTLRVLLSDTTSSFFSGTTNLASFPANFVGDSMIIKFQIPQNIPYSLNYRLEPELDGPVPQNWRFTASIGHELSIVERNDGLTANAGPNQSICSASTTLAANAPAQGATGIWTRILGNATIANPSLPSTQVSNLTVGLNRFVWTITANGLTSTDTVSILRLNQPVQVSAGQDQTVCTASALLSGNDPNIGTGTWSVVSGTGDFANPTVANTTVSGLSPGQNVFRWTISNGNCNAISDDVQVSYTPAAPANAGLNELVCITTTSVSLNGNDPGAGASVAWTSLGGATLSNATSPQASATNLSSGPNLFVYSVTTPGCPVVQDTVEITVRQLPTVANAGQDQNVCGNGTTLAGNTPSAGLGNWLIRSGSANVIDINNPTTQVTEMSPGTLVLRWSITNLPCPTSFDEVSINVTASNVVANAGEDTVVCGAQGRLRATAPTIGQGLWQLVSGSGNIVSPSNPNSAVTGLGFGINQFAWRVVDGTCSATDVVEITRPSRPFTLGIDTILCQSATIVLTPGSGYSSYSWSTGATTAAVTIDSSQAGSISVEVMTNDGCMFSDTINVAFAPCSQLDDFEKNTLSSLPGISPNPAKTHFSVIWGTPPFSRVKFELQTLAGKIIDSKWIDSNGGQLVYVQPVNDLPKGVYLVRIVADKQLHVRKLVIE